MKRIRNSTFKRIVSIFLLLCLFPSTFLTTFAAPSVRDGEVVKQGTLVASEDGIVTVHETAAHTSGNNFNVTMTVTVSDLAQITPAVPSHIVLCIDRSNSMDGDRRTNTKTAVDEFVAGVLNEDGIALGNQIAVVGFGTKYWNYCGLTSNVSTVNAAVTAATTAVNDVYDGGTNVQAGIYAAQQILAADTSSVRKIIVLLSDGMPTYSYRLVGTADWSGCSNSGQHRWNKSKGSFENISADFDHSAIVGSGSSYEYNNSNYYASLTVSCEHGKSTTMTSPIYTNNGQPAIVQANAAKDAGTEIYTVFLDGYSEEEQDSKAHAEETMKAVATDNAHYMITKNMSELAGLFKNIGSSLVTPTDAGTVVAPMGSYIQLGEVSSLESFGIQKTSSGLVWNVTSVTPTVDSATGTRSYTVTYPISLQTEEPGFVEAQPYVVNPSAVLTYYVGGEENQISFDIPTVRGYLPRISYSIYYYLQGAAAAGDYANYILTDIDADLTGKLGDKVGYPSGYKTKYVDYEFVYSSTGEELVLTPDGSNVMCLYYDSTYVPPIEVNYTVKHEYYTNGVKDGYTVSNLTATEGTQIAASDLDKILTYNGESYTFTSASPTVLIVSEGSSITLRYDRTVIIPPAEVGYTIRHEYYTNNVLEGATSSDLTAPEGTEISANSLDKVLTYNDEAYAFTSATPTVLTVSEGSSITLRYDRTVELPPVEVVYTVRHEYYTNDVLDGTTSVPSTGAEGTVLTADSLIKLPVYNMETYTFTSCTPSSLKLEQGTEMVFVLRYNRTVVVPPVDVPYTVVHAYYTNGVKDGEIPVQSDAPEGTEIFAADMEKHLVFSEAEYSFTYATPATIKLSADKQNVITFRYDRTYTPLPQEVEYTVIHEYFTNGEKDGEVPSPQIGYDEDVIRGDDLVKLPTYNIEEYEYVDSEPKELTLTPDTPAVIRVRYQRVVETPVTTKYTVIHQYYTGNKLDGQIQETIDADIGDIIESAGLTKNTVFSNGTYIFKSANYEILVVSEDGENKLILRYTRSEDSEQPDSEPTQPSQPECDEPTSVDPDKLSPRTGDNSIVWLCIFFGAGLSLFFLFVIPALTRPKDGSSYKGSRKKK